MSIIKVLHTHYIELAGGKGICFRLQDNNTIDITIELSETECYGVEVPINLFVAAIIMFLDRIQEILFDEPSEDERTCGTCGGRLP